LLFLGAASTIGVLLDLTRAAAVRLGVRALRGLVLGVAAFRHSPVRLWWSWAWRAAAGVAPVIVAAGIANRLGGRGGLALVALALAHQAVAFSRVALHASWLACALRAVDPERCRVESR
jgi:hypothetical protein